MCVCVHPGATLVGDLKLVPPGLTVNKCGGNPQPHPCVCKALLST